MKDAPIINVNQIADITDILGEVGIAKLQRGGKYPVNKRTGEKIKYADIVTAFDIETSRHQFGKEIGDWNSWMYIWQWQFGDIVTVIGHTWDEWKELVRMVNEWCDSNECRIWCGIHNLAYEFQFMAGVWDFAPEDVFATDVRSPLYCMVGNIEMRCTYRLSGYGLKRWCKELKTEHQKLDGEEFDYDAERYPWTELTEQQLAYCVHDVICVVEAVQKTLEDYGDTLYTIPYTSTGYIRRRVKTAMKAWSPFAVRDMQPPLYVYDRLREAFRGGDTHANRYWVQCIIGDVYSYDRSSSYPDVLVHGQFPMSKFREEPVTGDYKQDKKLFDARIRSKRCVLFKVRLEGVKLKDERTGNPYLPLDKCIGTCIGARLDNGRILSAASLEIAMTDIDWKIVTEQYDIKTITFLWMMTARYGYLPQPFVDVLIKLYTNKTALKGVEGREVVYMHSKGELNSCYGITTGMTVQRTITNGCEYINGEWSITPIDREDQYDKVINSKFLLYAWGVWTTAQARYELYRGVRECEKQGGKEAFVYCDTDSVKSTVPIDFSKYNAEKIKQAKASGAWAEDSKGRPHYMGVFESEGKYDLFRTLGAKRYCTQVGDKLGITVAGVPKEKGAEELARKGGIEAFDFNLVFSESGKTGAVYNDDADFIWELDNEHSIRITRNVSIIPVEYSMTLSRNYQELLDSIERYLDSVEYTDYNRKC